MHTFWIRLNAIVFFALTYLLGLSLLTSFTTTTYPFAPTTSEPIIELLRLSPKPPINPSSSNSKSLPGIKSLRSLGGVDRALLYFDLNVDLSPAFNWNVKQLFCFLVASYETEDHTLNQVVVWDKIVESSSYYPTDVKRIDIENLLIKYPLTDKGSALRGKDITLSFYWDTMPITSSMYMGVSDHNYTFTFPENYK